MEVRAPCVKGLSKTIEPTLVLVLVLVSWKLHSQQIRWQWCRVVTVHSRSHFSDTMCKVSTHCNTAYLSKTIEGCIHSKHRWL